MQKEESLLRILICDDDPVDRKLIKSYIKKIDNREIVISEAGQKSEIEKALKKGNIDLALLDMQMPEKSGMDWLAEIVEMHTIPAVMLTGYGNEDLAAQAIQQGAVGYLSKNYLSVEKLKETVDSALEKWAEIQQRRIKRHQLEELANIDSLTGLYNRRAVLRMLSEQIRHVNKSRKKLSIIMLDIDCFKKVNDKYGHLSGDEVLQQVANLISQSIRRTDTVGRFGGDEFLIILPLINPSNAVMVAERVCRRIEDASMTDSSGNVIKVTVSQGLSNYEISDNENSLISRADDALYRAKENGRNQVAVLA